MQIYDAYCTYSYFFVIATKDILIRLAALEGSFSDTHDDRIASNVDGAGDDDLISLVLMKMI